MMSNVARVFNDSVGVELVSRTGRNPCEFASPSAAWLPFDRLVFSLQRTRMCNFDAVAKQNKICYATPATALARLLVALLCSAR